MSAPVTETVSAAYLRLALAIEQHRPGAIDGYFGPPEWATAAAEAGPRPLTLLAREADDLAALIETDGTLGAQRRDFLARQVRAMQTTLRLLAGERLALADEVAALYDIVPTWIDEAHFEEACRALDEMLPPGETLAERMQARRQALELPVESARPLLDEIIEELRRRTRARFALTDDESFEMQIVTGQPWSAYNWYLGAGHSRIDVNTDLPLHVTRLVDLMAHEGYPGHHTEHAIKEQRLLRERGWLEQSVLLINAPECVVSEGIATRAREMVLTDDELVAWHQDELFPRAGLGHLDARREQTIDEAAKALGGALGNAAFLRHDEGASDEEVVAYLRRYGLRTEVEARQSLRFLTNPLYRSYIFTYRHGGELLDALFAARPDDRDALFARLLSEPVTPTQIRAWTAGSGDEGAR